MATLKAGTTVGGAALLLKLKPSHLTEGAGEAGQFLGVDYDNNVKFLSNFRFSGYGTVAGFASGGTNGGGDVASVDKFPFTSPFTTAASIGSLTLAREAGAGISSGTEGFTAGGKVRPIGYLGIATVDKFPFTVAPFVTATTAGNLTKSISGGAGQSSSNHGYHSGGYQNYVGTVAGVDKFPTVAPFTAATTVGNLTQSRDNGVGQTSSTEGFTSGGSNPFAVATIDKFPFNAPFTTATSAGSLSQARWKAGGHSSTTEGFTSGGSTPTEASTIDKFPFTSPFTTATSAGSLSAARQTSGHSSSTHGYASGGYQYTDIIDQFPTTSPFTTATTVGNLSVARGGVAGQYY